MDCSYPDDRNGVVGAAFGQDCFIMWLKEQQRRHQESQGTVHHLVLTSEDPRLQVQLLGHCPTILATHLHPDHVLEHCGMNSFLFMFSIFYYRHVMISSRVNYTYF